MGKGTTIYLPMLNDKSRLAVQTFCTSREARDCRSFVRRSTEED